MKPAPSETSALEVSGAGIYRPNVAAIITDARGLILVCERSDVDGSWQFPQGGLEPGESLEAGLRRELFEELSLQAGDYVIERCEGPYRYLFPPGRLKAGYRGQEQHYFGVLLTAAPTKIDIETEDHEFQSVRWIEPVDFRLDWLPEMKWAVYKQVFHDFFGVSLPPARALP